MKLFVDDLRNPLDFGLKEYIWVKTVEDAISFLENGTITFASLDHDLGHQLYDGTYLINYIEENNLWPINGVYVHSQNLVGKKRMNDAIKKYYGMLFDGPI